MSEHDLRKATVKRNTLAGPAQHTPARSGARIVAPAELLTRLWKQNLPLLRERIACLESAAAEAVAGSLSAARRTEASDLAHKLAGSLGMFGYPIGTDIARLMEQLLEAEGPVDATHFSSLVGDLKGALPLTDPQP